jgi:hypothetical protein
VNEQGVNDHEGRLTLSSLARRVVGLERRKGVFGVLGQRFSQCSWFYDLVRRGALKGATSATVTAPRCGSSNHHGDSVKIAAKRGAATLEPGRLSGDGPCGRLAGLPGRLAGLLAGPSGG